MRSGDSEASRWAKGTPQLRQYRPQRADTSALTTAWQRQTNLMAGNDGKLRSEGPRDRRRQGSHCIIPGQFVQTISFGRGAAYATAVFRRFLPRTALLSAEPELTESEGALRQTRVDTNPYSPSIEPSLFWSDASKAPVRCPPVRRGLTRKADLASAAPSLTRGSARTAVGAGPRPPNPEPGPSAPGHRIGPRIAIQPGLCLSWFNSGRKGV